MVANSGIKVVLKMRNTLLKASNLHTKRKRAIVWSLSVFVSTYAHYTASTTTSIELLKMKNLFCFSYSYCQDTAFTRVNCNSLPISTGMKQLILEHVDILPQIQPRSPYLERRAGERLYIALEFFPTVVGAGP